MDGSGYFPLRQPEEEAPFEGEKGTERAAQFAWCLGVRSPKPHCSLCSQAPTTTMGTPSAAAHSKRGRRIGAGRVRVGVATRR